MSLEFHLTHYERYRRQGLEALREGNRRRARFGLLKAAEHLFEVANKSEGRLRDERTRRARELLELARDVGAEQPVRPSRREGEAESGGPAGGEASYRIVERPDVTFADVAGLEPAKEEIRLKIIYPFLHREHAQRYGVRAGGGILLYGPPGTGKTLLARAVAGETKCAFFTVKPSEILSKWVGEAEQNLERLFDAAREAAPAIIFIDEIDALAPSREENRSSVMARLVPQILAELEGFDGRREPLLFIGATNEPWSLDPAILRPGRFDERIYVGLPDLEARVRLLELHLAGIPLAEDIDIPDLAGSTEGFSGADLRSICRKAADRAFLEAIEEGVERCIGQRDLLAAAGQTPASVPTSTLERFAVYAERGVR